MKTCIRYVQKTNTALKITILEFNTKGECEHWVKTMLPRDAQGFDFWGEQEPTERVHSE